MYILLVLFWIILNGRITVEITVIGMIFAAVIYLFAWKFMGLTVRKEKAFWIHFGWGIQYLLLLLKEIYVSNIAMVKIILSPKKKFHPVIVRFESPVNGDFRQVILANSITLTPGTITVRLYENKFEVHCLDESMAQGLTDSSFVKMLKKWEDM